MTSTFVPGARLAGLVSCVSLIVSVVSSTGVAAQTGPAANWTTVAAPAELNVPGAQWIKVNGRDGHNFLAAVLRPQGAGPFPVVVVLHGRGHRCLVRGIAWRRRPGGRGGPSGAPAAPSQASTAEHAGSDRGFGGTGASAAWHRRPCRPRRAVARVRTRCARAPQIRHGRVFRGGRPRRDVCADPAGRTARRAGASRSCPAWSTGGGAPKGDRVPPRTSPRERGGADATRQPLNRDGKRAWRSRWSVTV